MELASALSAEQWRAVYDSEPLGLRTASERLADLAVLDADEVLRRTLGNPEAAENLGGGRANFLSGCYDRLVAAAGAAAKADELTGCDFVSGYGPFLDLIPPEAAGIRVPIGDLADLSVRSEILARYRHVLAANAGRNVVSPTQLAEEPERIATALALESVNAIEKQRATLADELVQLCSFIGTTPKQVERCQRERLRWLGYSAESVATLHADVVPIGGNAVRTVTSAETFQQWLIVIGVLFGLFGVGSCGVYTVIDVGTGCSVSPDGGGGPGSSWLDWVPGLVACGPGLLGIAGIIGGFLGAIAGLLVNGFMEKRTTVGTRARLAGRALAIAAASVVASLLFVPAFVGQG